MGSERLYPLSSPQQAIWLDQLLSPDLPCYNVGVAVQLDGQMDLARFESAIQHVVARRDALRMVLVQDECARQQFLPHVDLALPRFDFSMWADADERAWEHLRREFSIPFALYGPKLWKMQWIQVGTSRGIWLLCFHHLVADGSSVSLICNAVVEAYNRSFRGNPTLPDDSGDSSYRQFIVQDLRYLTSDRCTKDRQFWMSRFPRLPEPLIARARTGHGGQRSEQVVRHLSRSVFARLTSAAALLECSSAHFLLAVLASLFARLTHDREEIVIGVPLHNRNGAQQRQAIGMFSSLIPLGVRVDPATPFARIVREVAAELKRGYRHQRFPAAELNRLLRQGTPAGRYLFDVVFSMESFAGDLRVEGGVRSTVTRLHNGYGYGRSTLSIAVQDYEKQRDLPVEFSFDPDVLNAHEIEILWQRIERFIAHAVVAPETPVCLLPLLSAEERLQVLEQFNDTQCEYPKEALIQELFEQQVRERPQATAVECEGERLSYAELNAKANQLAHHLRSLGVRPDDRVALCLERSLEMVVAILATLKAGGAYVPLDPSYPTERLQYMLKDAAPKVLLTQVELNERVWEAASTENLSAQELGLRSSHLAYVIYTSGSTGAPKGVMVEHRNAVNFISWAVRYFSEEQLSRALFSTSINFDLAVFELFAPLSCGGSAVLVKDLLAVRQSAHSPSLLNTVPSAISALRSANAIPASAQSINLAGERLERSLVESLFESGHIRRIANLYGPSETTTYSTAVVMDKSSGYVSHIGRPIANTRIYILDTHQEPVPVGVVGEIYIGGAGVARGYLNREELTRERFVPDPFSREPDARMYRSGDLGRWTADGNIEFLGRNDHQVKLRGYRIELGEIEAQLVRVPGVREAVVVAREEGAGEKRLVAYVVGGLLDPAQLRARLSEVLPEHMVPAAYVRLEQLPLTPNGKLDRRALPAPESEAFVQKRYESPVGEIEQTLVRIWSALLGVEQIGRHDNFFELGGHSLLAVQLISRMRQRLGVELSLQGLFAQPVLRELAEQVAQAARSTVSVIPVADRSGPLGLSYAQERLWFITQMDEQASAAYHMAGGLRLRGRLDEGALVRALDRIVQRHEALRTRFVSVEGKPRQVIDTSPGFTLSRQDASSSQLQEACEQEARTPFDLAEGPLVRGRLIRLSEEDHVLLVTLHHIVCDGWSLSVLTKELSALYQAYRQGELDPLPELSLQYADYAVWQRRWLQGERQRQQLQYWVEQLRGAPELVSLPTDRPRPQLQDYCGASIPVSVDAALTQELKALSQRHGTTLYMTVLAGWAAVVSRLSGQDEVVIGSPIANRQRAEVEPLIGLFVNTQALKVDLSHSPSVQQLLAQVRRTALQGQENPDVPFEQVVEELKPARSLSHSPVFQLMLAWQNTPAGELDLGDLRWELLESRTDREKLDLTLSLQEAGDEIVGQLSYATALFDEATVRRHWAYLQAMLQGMVRDAHERIDQIELLSAVEREQVLRVFNETQCEYPKEALIQELFEQQVHERPQATAVECEGERLSYAELNAKANQLAHHLRRLGVRPDDRVALCLERSAEMVVAILATLKAGGAYVPLDPTYPTERLQYMLKDAAPKVLLTQIRQRQRLGRYEGGAVVELDERVWAHTASTENLSAHELGLRSSHLAYVIYTSGSTGAPKGVMVEHRNAVNFISWAVQHFSEEQLSRTLFSTSINFDLAVFELFAPLSCGGSAVLVKDLLSVSQSAPNPSLLNTVPSAINALRSANAIPASAHSINLAGERLERSLVEGLFESGHIRRIANLYGPTETTTYSTAVVMDKSSGYASHIGRPIANTQIYILDTHREPVPVGVVGEIYIGGAGVARGYLNREELTQERFLPDAFSSEPGARMYRTGDLGRHLPDGNIELLGRNDHQVKIRGYRIELAEIEAQLARLPGVREAVVVAREDGAGAKRLVAYVVGGLLDPAQLRARLSEVLPEHMVPAAYVSLEQLPLTPNGKLDRRALPAPEGEAFVQKRYESPVGESEQALAQIWSELLGVEPIGRHDSFFELGGHSLLAVQLEFMIKKRFGTGISLRRLHERQQLAQMAQRIEQDLPQPKPTRKEIVLEL